MMFTLKRVTFLLFALLGFSILLAKSYNPDTIEIKYPIIESLVSGALCLWIVFALLVVGFIYNVKNENKKGTNGFRSFLYLCLLILLFMIVLGMTIFMSMASEKYDAIIYQNKNRKNEMIICQFFFSGIASSNYNWRIVKTKNDYWIFRKIELLNDSLLKQKLNIIIDEDPDSIPSVKSFEIDNDLYSLKEYKIYKGQHWEDYTLDIAH